MSTISSTEFDKDPKRALRLADAEPVIVLGGDEPSHVLMSVPHYKAMMERQASVLRQVEPSAMPTKRSSPRTTPSWTKGKDEYRRNGLGVKQALSLAEHFKLSQADLARILGTSPRTLRRWAALFDATGEVRLGAPTVERLSYLLGIWKALQTLVPGQGSQWLRNANSGPMFRGQSPLVRLVSGRVGDLQDLRRYLDAAFNS